MYGYDPRSTGNIFRTEAMDNQQRSKANGRTVSHVLKRMTAVPVAVEGGTSVCRQDDDVELKF